MTVDDIEDRIERIERLVKSGDNGCAHGDEDDLLCEVLEYIAKGANNPQELAVAALRVKKFAYSRWYA